MIIGDQIDLDHSELFRLQRPRNAPKMRFARNGVDPTVGVLVLMILIIEINRHAAGGAPYE
jgi:hypothetical protein